MHSLISRKSLVASLACITFFLFLETVVCAEVIQNWNSRSRGGLDFLPSAPTSEFVGDPDTGLDPAFCADWNPDFGFRGGQCCGKISWKQRRRGVRCSPARAKTNFCDEITETQKSYLQLAQSSQKFDVLDHLQKEMGRYGTQAYCSPSSGFLAWGRPLVPSEMNRVVLRRPERCVNFGTDRMVAMLEWLGREVRAAFSAEPYSGVRLLVGDISAPRGGCLSGRGGRGGHASHMTGQDVDIGFINVQAKGRSPSNFTRNLDVEQNWWLLKKIFSNPFVCIQAIFLDRRHITKIARHAAQDSQWLEIGSRIRHVRRHRDHFHVRIGESQGTGACPRVDEIKDLMEWRRASVSESKASYRPSRYQ